VILIGQQLKQAVIAHHNDWSFRASAWLVIVYCDTTSQLVRHSIHVHNSRRPFDRLTVYDYIEGSIKEQPRCNSMAVQRSCSNILTAMLLHFVTLWPWPLTFWPNINWWASYRDGLSLCQVWWFYFQPFWFYRADRRSRLTDQNDCSCVLEATVKCVFSLRLELFKLIIIEGQPCYGNKIITLNYILFIGKGIWTKLLCSGVLALQTVTSAFKFLWTTVLSHVTLVMFQLFRFLEIFICNASKAR